MLAGWLECETVCRNMTLNHLRNPVSIACVSWLSLTVTITSVN